MGFTDTKCLNQALLVRQAWRVIESAEDLCARFCKGEVLKLIMSLIQFLPVKHPKHGEELSSVWNCLKRGIVTRIGNRNSIPVWRDN